MKLANRVDLGDGTVRTEGDGRREVVDALVGVQRRLDVSAQLDALLAVHGAEDAIGEDGGGVCHGEGSRSSSVLGLDNLVTTELDALDESSEGLASLVDELLALSGLREQGDDGDTGVTTNNRNVGVGGFGAGKAGDEGRGANDVEGGDTKEAAQRLMSVDRARAKWIPHGTAQYRSPLGIVDASLLENLCDDRNSRVDRVGNDTDASLGGNLG